MNWTQLLTCEVESVYHATEGLLKLVKKDTLGWKPATGSNWMTVGQLLAHLPTACGFCMNGFLTGEWGMPEPKPGEAPSEDSMLPPAEKMPSAKTVASVVKALAADKALALSCIEKAGEKALGSKKVAAPWDPTPQALGVQFLHMIGHLSTHKAQLFYYLKLQGLPVHTGNLWGM